ncbi:MAG TPA: bifunctional shikimate kinase/3-dehydroquinate synthase [Solirubrobacteraceae bacterium]|nr:bifunctional shikimate kinase/3-dehydroquinate synthase [Solirubrobacteraceae bacterium]
MAFVLIGFMGAGKSTAARELAAALGSQSYDSDELLAERFGHPVAREFELHGEQAFRAAEEQLVCELLARARREGAEPVIALGGGSVLSERVREALVHHVTVLLDVDAQTAWRRVDAARAGRHAGAAETAHETDAAEGADAVETAETAGARSLAGERPLARERERFLELHASRAELYERLADAIFREPPRGTLARAARALRALAAAPAGTRMLWASAASGSYPVLVGRGLVCEAGRERIEAVWPLERSRSRAFCVSDETVLALYGARLGEMTASFAIAPGEAQKTLASAQLAWQAMVEAGITRADHVVALGGGVVGDLAGFCAACYQRGVPVVHVPTSLVAQVDSAYGGKTGVDLPQAKNYVGAYHQPAGVLVDPDALATLPAAELAAGWVEVLKTALIAGGELWEAVAAGGGTDERAILACARTKLAVVAQDERDGGRRQVLNLGHTVGHAIETATGYARYRHGEAVGLGLLAALRLSGQPQLREQVGELMSARGLPVTLNDERDEGLPSGEAAVDAILQAMTRDKKRLGEDVPFVLVRAPGEVQHGCAVAAQDVRAAVRELLA